MSQCDDDKLVTEQPWLKQAVDELRQPVEPSVAGQLRAARRGALAQEPVVKQSWLEKFSLPTRSMALAAGLGAIAVASMVVLESQTETANTELQAKATNGNALLEDLSIMAAQDDLQFYQDLELMQWLAEEGGIDVQS